MNHLYQRWDWSGRTRFPDEPEIPTLTHYAPLIVLTSLNDQPTIMSIINQGANDCLPKVELSETLLERVIRFNLDRWQLHRRLHNSERNQRELLNTIPNALLVVQEHCKVVYSNPAAQLLFGYPEHDEADCPDFIASVADDFQPVLKQQLRSLLCNEPGFPRLEGPLLGADGEPFDAFVTAVAHEYQGERAVLLIIEDVTIQNRYLHELEWNNQANRVFEQLLTLAITEHETQSYLQLALETIIAFEKFGGLRKGAIFLHDEQQQRLQMVAYVGMDEPLLRECAHVAMGHCLCGRAAMQHEVVYSAHVDEQHDVRYDGMQDHGHYCVPIMGDNNTLIGVFNCYLAPSYRFNEKDERFLINVSTTLAMVIERHRANEALKALATSDPLTHLPNRTLLFERFHYLVKEAHRYAYGIAVLFIDLDQFKMINDTLGHKTGDLLLVEVAARLLACVRDIDVVARIGGDEFVVLLSHVSQADNALHIAHKIIAQLTRPFVLEQQICRIGCSIGIAEYPGDGHSAEELLRKADEAMYAVKYTGRNHAMRYHLEWSDRLSMMNPEIDAEHQHLIDMLQQLEGEPESAVDEQQRMLRIFDQLMADTVTHFAHEERLFSERGFPGAAEHVRIHAELLQQLGTLRGRLQTCSSPDEWSTARSTINDLLVTHILKDDSKYIDYLRTYR